MKDPHWKLSRSFRWMPREPPSAQSPAPSRFIPGDVRSGSGPAVRRVDWLSRSGASKGFVEPETERGSDGSLRGAPIHGGSGLICRATAASGHRRRSSHRTGGARTFRRPESRYVWETEERRDDKKKSPKELFPRKC